MIKSVLFLLTIIGTYYFLFKKYPERFTNKIHFYFAVFSIIYLIIIYLLNHEKMFVYRVVKNMKDSEENPLYDSNDFYKENQMVGLKNNIAMRQGWRCMSCKNPLLQKDIGKKCKLNYIRKLEFGGVNHLENIGLHCASCSTFI